MRERLIELIKNSTQLISDDAYICERVSDHLLANGVIVCDTLAVEMKNRPLITQCLGRPLDEIIELVQAKDDGRIVVPPCKVGDTIYYISGFNGVEKICGKKVKRIWFDNEGLGFTVSGMYMDFNILENETYITREEAEKALKEGDR